MSGIRWTAEQLSDYQRKTAKSARSAAIVEPVVSKPVRAGKSTGGPVILPLKTKSTINLREHWTVRSARVKIERTTACDLCPAIVPPCTVTLTRIAPRELDDDNLRSALKAVRDGIADAIGIDDRNPSVKWQYCQRKGRAREYGVEVRIT